MRGLAGKGVFGLVLALLLLVSMGLAWAPEAAAAQNGLIGEYYNNTGTGPSPPPPPGSPVGTTFTGAPVLSRIDASVNFNPFAVPPGTGVNSDDFMIAWTGRVTATVTGAHTFGSRADDGTRVWVNGTLLFDNWVSQGAPTNPQMGMATVALTAGTPVTIRVEFYEDGGAEVCQLYWQPPGAATPVVIPSSQLTPPAPPPAPTGVTATGGFTPGGAAQVVITWMAVSGATSYRVEKANAVGGPYTQIASVTGLSYTDTAVTFGNTYYYRVIAVVNALLVSAPSTPASATPMPPPPKSGTSGSSNNLAHRCGCNTVAGVPAGFALWGAGLLVLALGFRRRR